ncbi:ATP-binding protein [Thalassobius sp. Cn5-15]|uniref:ATP-binding protein n=1 Tax=Thalassobius sp. Cn5-15 TaxID=2917763 RepID=UPI001EF31C08|nr:ATP-binding protein [Thalassobius sp. Cn5-15]MCG7494158.1 ATP-binding protein [Thalassobius sp. Cn5-15]
MTKQSPHMTLRPDIDARQRDMNRRIKASYVALCIFVGVCVFWFIYFGLTQQWFEMKLALLALGPYPLFFALLWRGWLLLGRILWLSWLTLFMLVLTFVPVLGASAALHFYSALAFPLLIFSWRYERRTLTISLCLIALASIVGTTAEVLHLGKALGLMPNKPDPMYPELRILFNQLSVAVIILIEMIYFGCLTEAANAKASKALQDAKQSARAKGEFLANMSHEIRTPMNGLVGMLDVLENQGLDQRQTATVGTMRNSAMSLLRIINDILDASKIEAGKLDIDLHRTEFLPLVESVVQMLRPLADEAGVTLRLYLDPELPAFITTDAGRIRQILLNLSSNAIKFSSRRITNRQGDVLLWVEKCDTGMVKFRVTDNGIGMDDNMLSKLFQPFSQADSATNRRVSGTGLGLTITRNLTDLMGGKIEVSSTLGQGTDITVHLPLHIAAGDSTLPKINSAQLVCFSYEDININCGLQGMLTRSGAETHFVNSLDELAALQPGARTVVLLPTDNQEAASALEEKVRAIAPACGVVRFSSDRTAQFGHLSNRSVLVQIKPMLLSDMMQAIADLAGLSTPVEMPKSNTSTQQCERAPALHRVLVIEDNEINRVVLGKQLDILNYPHEMAIDGAEGLALWRTGRFDVVLTDCHMPVMDGFELTNEIRKAEAGSSHRTPIIAVTANALDGEAERCLNAGMDDYLPKPLELETLRQKLDGLWVN